MGLFRNLMAAAAVAAASASASADVWQHDWSLYNDSGGYGELHDELMYIVGGDVGVPGWTAYTTTVCALSQFQFNVNYSSDDSQQFDFFYIQVNGNEVARIYNEDEGNDFGFAYILNAGDTITLGVYTVDGDFGAGLAVVHELQCWSLLGIDDLDWAPYSENGSGSVTLPPPYLSVVGGDAGFEDRTDGFTVPQVPMYALAGGNYSSPDEGEYDQGYYYTSGEGYVPFITNATQGDFAPFFVLVPASYILAYGVYTFDGSFGPGAMTISSFTGYMYPGILNGFFWSTNDNAGGSVDYGDGVVNVNGGNVGVPGHTEFVVQAQFDYCVETDFYYSSVDEGTYDSAYYTINGQRYWIADNDWQGAWYADFEVKKGDTFGFGVETVDGDFGPGILSVYRLRTWAQPSTSCYPDCDDSGFLDFFDFLCFSNAFNADDPYADCDISGGFDLFDFLCYVNAFNDGC